MDAEAATEFVFTIENTVRDVTMTQSRCESHEDGLAMTDNGASVNVCFQVPLLSTETVQSGSEA